jgi:glycosyltransferase involved in cell wall biosynthesis
MIRVILLTQYYPPETGAPQNRLHELALRLIHNGFEIEVITAMPNYPAMEIHPAYKGKGYIKENIDGISVHRTSIYVSKSKSIVPRLLNYFSFVFSSIWHGWRKLENADILICESPPLFLGISAYLLSRRKKAKLIMNISDLWPESAEKLGLVTNQLLLKSAEKLEMFLYRKSWIITGQTMGIVRNIEQRNPGKRVYWLPNGVDLSYYNPDRTIEDWRAHNSFSSSDFIILYAGILGHAQGLEVILNAAAITRNETQIKWVLVGAGPVKLEMQRMKGELGLENVYFFDPVSKDKMPSIVAAADVAVIPLKKLDLFKGAIPSKIFESLAMRKPLLLGVEGEAEELFIRTGNCGLSFIPEDPTSLAASALELARDPEKCRKMGIQARRYVSEVFDREKIAAGFATFIRDAWLQEKSIKN